MAAKKPARKKSARTSARKSAKKSAKKSARKSAKKSAVRKASKKKASKKKAGKKKSARKTTSSRGPGRPPGGDSKTRGSSASRRLIRQVAKRLLHETEGRTREAAAEHTGAHVDDIKNLKAGNLPSLKLFLRVVRNGNYDPEALISRDQLRKLSPKVSTRGAHAKLISERIRKLAKEQDPAELSKASGLSIYTIYQHRVANKRVGLHTVLAFVDSGAVSAREVFLG